MPKQIIIAEQHHIAAVFLNQIQELVVATGHHQIGDIYLGVVENILPGIDFRQYWRYGALVLFM